MSPGNVKDRLAAVVVHYRTPRETAACLAALARSRRTVDHVVVVDNAPAEGGRPALRAHLDRSLLEQVAPAEGGRPALRAHLDRSLLEQVDWLQAHGNPGFSAGANRGIRRALEAGATLVLLLNSDATVDPVCVALLEGAMARPGVGLAGAAIIAQADSATLESPGSPTDSGTLESLGITYSRWSGRMRLVGCGQSYRPGLPPRTVDALSGCALLIRREVFAAVGLLAEEYFFGFEDLDFCLRAARAGFTSICVPEARVLHRGGASLGPGSPGRAYFAGRNHLLLARRACPLPAPLSHLRAVHVVALNLAHLVLRSQVPLLPGARALARGVADYLGGRFGRGPMMG